MFWHRPTSEIVENWQTELENRLAWGQPSLLPLGTGDTAVFGILQVLTLVNFENQRTDIMRPTILIGGSHTLWTAALLWYYRDKSPATSPRLQIVYAGSDLATYLFSQDLWLSAQLQKLPNAHPTSGRYFADIPPSMLRFFIPAAQPSVAPNWEMLPFLIKELQEPAGKQMRWASSDSWMAWSVIVLVLVLILTALAV